MTLNEIAAEVAQANDRLRKQCAGEQLKISPGIRTMPPRIIAEALFQMRTFDNFGAQTDPYGYHDFGSFEVRGHTLYFMITGSEEHGQGLAVRNRICSLMLAQEYVGDHADQDTIPKC